jgi:hypothetical protein
MDLIERNLVQEASVDRFERMVSCYVRSYAPAYEDDLRGNEMQQDTAGMKVVCYQKRDVVKVQAQPCQQQNFHVLFAPSPECSSAFSAFCTAIPA